MKKIYFLLFINLTFCVYGFGQNKDSLVSALKKSIRGAASDSAKIEYQMQLVSEIWTTEVDTSQIIVNDVLKIINKKRRPQFYFQQKKGDAYNNLGLYDNKKGNYAQAIGNHFKALSIRKSIRDTSGIGQSFSNIGLLYRKIKEYEKAKDYLKNAIGIRETQSDKKKLALTYNALGTTFYYAKQVDSALYYHKKALEADTSETNKTFTNQNLASIYFANNKLDEALGIFKSNIAIYKKSDKPTTLTVAYLNTGVVLEKLKDYKKAVIYIDSAITISKEKENYDLLQKEYLSKSNIYSTIGNNKKALEDYKIYESYKDSLYDVERAKKLIAIELENKFKQEKLADSLQQAGKRQLMLKELENQKATSIRNYIIIGILLLLIVLAIIYAKKRLDFAKLKQVLLQKEIGKKEETIERKQEQVSTLLTESLLYLEDKKNLLEKLEKASDVENGFKNASLKSIIAELKAEGVEESKISIIREHLSTQNHQFLETVKEQHSKVSTLDLELCAFIKMGLSRKEIAKLRGTSADTIKKARYRLRKKLGVSEDVILEEYFQDL